MNLSEKAFNAAMEVYGIKRGGGIIQTETSNIEDLNASLLNLSLNIYRVNLMLFIATETDKTKRFNKAIHFYQAMHETLEKVQADFLESLLDDKFKSGVAIFKSTGN